LELYIALAAAWNILSSALESMYRHKAWDSSHCAGRRLD